MRLRRHRSLLLFAPLVSLLGCVAGLPQPTAADGEAARARWQDSNQAELQHGRGLLMNRCAGCHAVPMPNDETPERWPAVVEEMAEPAGLSPKDQESVVRYLVITSTRR